MMALNKWLRYYTPLYRGRFDFFISNSQSSRESWHQALSLTGGRFWVRVAGGHNLRRREIVAGDMNFQSANIGGAAVSLSLRGVLVGRADGHRAEVTTFPWVPHPAERAYRYTLSVVGAGGVEDDREAPSLRLCFDQTGVLLGPAPNPIEGFSVVPIDGGRFRLLWAYDETHEPAPPASFQIFNDLGNSGTVNADVVVATVPYSWRQGFYAWSSGPFAHDQRIGWSVRAVGNEGTPGPLSLIATATARLTPPPVPDAVRIGRFDQGT